MCTEKHTTCNQKPALVYVEIVNYFVKGTFHGKLNNLQLIFIDCCDEK